MTSTLLRTAILALMAAMTLTAAHPQVKPGIEVLRDSGFKQLRGKRVGLVTNPTGVDRTLQATIDILAQAPEVDLKALFAPEHGVRGDIPAGHSVATYRDKATGITVYSLYGRTRKPTAAMLDGIDILVYDIQDNGCRSYTFISTMGKAMEACAELGKEFMVLDRPNPLGGNKIEGCIAEKECISFVSQYPIPYIYGLTCGELARYINESGLLAGGVRANLTVIPMEGWTRDMSYSDTGLPWILPSPHLPSAETAMYYPASGIIGELDYLSIGVGYTLPFRLFCASWIDAGMLSRRLNALAIPGVMFRPLHIRPYYGTGKGENLQGVELHITDAGAAPLTLIQFYVAQEIAAAYPSKAMFKSAIAATRLSMFDKVCGTREIRRRFSRAHRVADIEAYWHKDTADFRQRSARFHIYR